MGCRKRILLFLVPAAVAFGQFEDNQTKNLQCSDRNGDARRQRFCEVREETLPAAARLAVDAGRNGGVSVKDLEVKAHNGGVHAELNGNRWEGSEFNVETMNGGVHLDVPENDSAQLEAGTVNGRVHVSGATMDKDARSYRGTMGSGGAPVRLMTRNGGVHVGRK